MDLLAKSAEDVAAELAEARNDRRRFAAAGMRAMGEIARQVHEGNVLSASIDTGISNLVEETGRLIETVRDGFEQLDKTVDAGFTAVVSGLVSVAFAICENQKKLAEISHTLSHRHGTEVKELFDAGEKWLIEGCESDKRKADDPHEARNAFVYWETALKRFNDVVTNPIGEHHYVAWFNVGWLLWMLKAEQVERGTDAQMQTFREAEDAFEKAQIFSAQTRDLWHSKSLRFMAEMQYLQGRYEDAWQTSQRAIQGRREFESLYNAARYASKLGRRGDVAKLLNECIDLRPFTIEDMFFEEDFKE